MGDIFVFVIAGLTVWAAIQYFRSSIKSWRDLKDGKNDQPFKHGEWHFPEHRKLRRLDGSEINHKDYSPFLKDADEQRKT
jgi:hypothetical protein